MDSGIVPLNLFLSKDLINIYIKINLLNKKNRNLNRKKKKYLQFLYFFHISNSIWNCSTEIIVT